MDELEKLVLEKINVWAQAGRLATHSKLPDILHQWRRWGTEDDVERFVGSMIATDHGLVAFLSSFLSKSISYSSSDNVESYHWWMSVKRIEEFVSLPSIEKRVREMAKTLAHEGFTEKQKLVLQTLIDTIDGNIKEPD